MAPSKLVRLSAYNRLQPPRLSLSRAFILHPKPLGAPGVDLDDGTVLAYGRRRRCSRVRLGRERLSIVVVVVLGFGFWGSSFGVRGSGFGVQGLEMRDESLGIEVVKTDSGFLVQVGFMV